MSMLKYIYWRPDLSRDGEGKVRANIHLLVGYNQGTLVDFHNMAEELRRTFPQATDEEIRGGKVFRSSQVDGFTIITWSAYLPKGEYPGWEQVENGSIEYCW